MKHSLFLFLGSLALTVAAGAQAVDLTKTTLQPVGVSHTVTDFSGRSAVRVTKSPAIEAFDEPTFVKLVDTAFRDGIIEVDVLSRLLANAPPFSRGFIGLAFRINEDNSRFESIYIRPTNGRADDQVRRNRSTQYFSYPDFKFDRLRNESPERYESYADMTLDAWISLKIVVTGEKAQLYVNGSEQPVLIVNDLKHGAGASGAIGLWVDVGTEGYFSNLRIHPR